MLILDIINKSTICTPLQAKNKPEVLRELATLLKNAGLVSNLDMACAAINNREELGSTGLGEEIAIPHAKTETVQQVAIAVGIAPHGIDFDSLDGKPVKVFFLILANPNYASAHIEVLSQIAKLTRSKDFCANAIAARTNEELLAVLQTHS